jgi:microcompartment protein CcmL/EutN
MDWVPECRALISSTCIPRPPDDIFTFEKGKKKKKKKEKNKKRMRENERKRSISPFFFSSFPSASSSSFYKVKTQNTVTWLLKLV